MDDTQITQLLRDARKTLLSYEFFPPKEESGMARLRAVAEVLRGTAPDFVTCTWGAGGSTRERTLEVCDLLRDVGLGPVMPHLTCVGTSRGELKDIADEFHDRGFRNIMTLRGDPPKGTTRFEVHRDDGLANACDLVELLKERHGDFCCGVAGYPEAHPEAASPEADLKHLKYKVDAGADFITTQLFFDNEVYKAFLSRCREHDINIPILPGLLPAMSVKQVSRFTQLCGSSFPAELLAQMEEAGGAGAEAEQVGIDWAARQISGLLENGAPAVHLYVLNRSKAALAPAVKECFSRAG